MDLHNLLNDYLKSLNDYIELLKHTFNLSYQQEINISKFDFGVMISINLGPLYDILLNNSKIVFETYAIQLFTNLKYRYNFSDLKINFAWNKLLNIYLEFQLNSYPSTLLNLPDEIIHKIFVKSTYQEIENLCLSDPDVKEKLCDSDNFWWKKLIHDYDNKFSYKFPYIPGCSKQMYLNHGLTLYLGKPEQIYLPYKTKKIFAKKNLLFFLDEDNFLWKMANYSRSISPLRFKKENRFNLISPLKFKMAACASSCLFAIDLKDNIWKFKYNNIKFIGNVKNPKQISCGNDYALIIDENNDLWGFGSNNKFQLFGLPNNYILNPTKITLPFKVKFIACGAYLNMLIDTDDNLWASGSSNIGLGTYPYIESSTDPINLNLKAKFVACAEEHCMIIDINDDLWGFGSNRNYQIGFAFEEFEELLKIDIDFKVKSVSCGLRHTLVIDQDDNLWGVGQNKNKQLGLFDDKYECFTRIPLGYKIDSIACNDKSSLIKILY